MLNEKDVLGIRLMGQYRELLRLQQELNDQLSGLAEEQRRLLEEQQRLLRLLFGKGQ